MITIKTNINETSCKLFRGIITDYIDTETDVESSTVTTNEARACIYEAVNNVLLHAYPNSKDKPITVTIDHQKEKEKIKLVIIVEDEGVGMTDVKKCMEPMYTTAKNESRCGLGFTILETMSNNLLVTSNPGSGTRVEITKYID